MDLKIYTTLFIYFILSIKESIKFYNYHTHFRINNQQSQSSIFLKKDFNYSYYQLHKPLKHKIMTYMISIVHPYLDNTRSYFNN
jgi:hypothetical protein